MARVKNVRGGLGDEDSRPPPSLPADPKGKATKKLVIKKRKYPDANIARAAAAVVAAKRAEAGGARSGVQIIDQLSPSTRATLEQVERRHGGPTGTIMVAGWRVVLDESRPQGESSQQQPPPAEPQPAQETQEGQ